MQNTPLSGLKPAPLWNYFYEICQVPRPSKKEEKILEYLISFCKKHKLEYKQDKVKNIIVSKAATPGMEKRSPVILQGHVDMVCEKNSDVVHDFDVDPIQPVIDGDWVKAKGTTLGADNGIAVATMLMLLSSNDIQHGPLECLFTIDEETGLNGANGLDGSLLKGNILLNLDTEDEGVFTVGCAGGMDTTITLEPFYEKLPSSLETYTLNVKGLLGGHSGVDIHKGHANANKILAHLLLSLSQKNSFKLVSITGGNLRNAIARESTATIAINPNDASQVLNFVKSLEYQTKKDFEKVETKLSISFEKNPATHSDCMKEDFQSKLIQALVDCPHGVLKMNAEIPTLVQTSTNLASIKVVDGKIVITTSQRSSVTPERDETSLKVKNAFEPLQPKIHSENSYPGWTPNFKSPVLDLFKKTYVKTFGKEPIIEVIHAGLECGLIGEKKPSLDMISFGPTIKYPHSPDEKVQISTVDQYWTLLIQVLKEI